MIKRTKILLSNHPSKPPIISIKLPMMLILIAWNSLAIQRAGRLQMPHFLDTLNQTQLFDLHSTHRFRLLRDTLVVLLSSDLEQGRVEVIEVLSLGLLMNAKSILLGLVLSLR